MKIAIISGTARKGRKSHRVALALQKTLGEQGHDIALIDVAKLELDIFTGLYKDLDAPNDHLQEAKTQLEWAEAMVFVTPEYNGSISSSLKNFIDLFAKAPFEGKPIGVATASSGPQGGIRAAYMLQQIILSIFAYPQPQMLTVAHVQDSISEDGSQIDNSIKKRYDTFIESYNMWIKRFSS